MDTLTAMRLANPKLSRFSPMSRIISFDDFDEALPGGLVLVVARSAFERIGGASDLAGAYHLPAALRAIATQATRHWPCLPARGAIAATRAASPASARARAGQFQQA